MRHILKAHKLGWLPLLWQ